MKNKHTIVGLYQSNGELQDFNSVKCKRKQVFKESNWFVYKYNDCYYNEYLL